MRHIADLSCMVVLYCKCVFLISASEIKLVTFETFLLFSYIYRKQFHFFYEEDEVGFYFGIFDIYFGIRDICQKIISGYLRK